MLGPVFVVGITIMLKRVINLHLATLVCLSFLPMYACSNGDSDDGQFTFGSFSTTATTTFSTTVTTQEGEEEESGDGETTGDGDGDSTGDGDGDGDTNGDGDGDAGDGDGDADTNDTDCPLGEFGCPCDNGQCVPGLVCGMDGLCGLGGGDGDGDPTTGDGDGDPYDPAGCMMPSSLVGVNGLEGELCSPPCVDSSDCPAGPVGTDGQCALILDGAVDPSNCVLVCDPLNDACPPGSTCKDVPDQPGLGLCTYP